MLKVQIAMAPNWVIEVNDGIKNMPDISAEAVQWKKRSIYLLPANVTALDNDAYKPQVVSIGPYHHGQKHLEAMEEHKHRALLHFIKRYDKPIESYIEALAPMVEDLKNAYDQLQPEWKDNNAFLKMMVYDGCFILEILRLSIHSADDYAAHDPIFSDHGYLYTLPFLRRDMLLLENQVPLQVIVKLLAVADPNAERGGYLRKRYLNRFFSMFEVPPIDECLHLLDAYRKCLLGEAPSRNHRIKSERRSPYYHISRIPSATKLQDAGIRIKRSWTYGEPGFISFHRKTLKLPEITVDNDTKSRILNLMAFERLHVGAGNKVTSYVAFLNALLTDSEDVSLLCSHGIIYNALGSDDDVAKLFRLISEYGSLDPDRNLDDVYLQVSYKLKQSFSKRIHEWRADLVRTYFKSPWVAISVIAAILLFALTIIQTVYSILSVTHRD